MRLTPGMPRRSVLAAAGLSLAVTAAPGIPAAGAAGPSGPVVKLEAAQRSITLDSFGGKVYLDPGIWVAALGSPLQFDVQRASYTRPITITQVIHPPSGGTVRSPLPASLLAGWSGLRGFFLLTARNSAGKVAVSQSIPFCPNSFFAARVSPGSPPASPYPPQCISDPFVRAMVWGVQKDWAADPLQDNFLLPAVKLALGVYQVTATIGPRYVRLLHISPRDATATVRVKVVKGPRCCPIPGCCSSGGPRHSPTAGTPRRPPAAADLRIRRGRRCPTWWRCPPGRSAPATRARARTTSSISPRRCGSAATAPSTSRASARTPRRS